MEAGLHGGERVARHQGRLKVGLDFNQVLPAQPEGLCPGGGKPETVRDKLQSTGQLVEPAGVGGGVRHRLGGVRDGIVEFPGFFRQLIDMPGELLSLGCLSLSVGEGAVCQQQGGDFLAHLAQLLA